MLLFLNAKTGIKHVITFIFIIFNNLIVINAQDFLSLISPFIGSGLTQPSPPAGGGGFGQGLASAFSNSGGGNNPFGDLIQLGQTFAGALNKNPPAPPQKQPPKTPPKPKDKPKPQSDAPPVTASPLAMFRGPSLIPLEDEPLLKIFKRRRFNIPPPRAPAPPTPRYNNGLIPLSDEPLLKIFKQRESGGRASQGPSRANSPFIRLTENFGKNFFHMMDELEEYTGPNARAASKGVSGLTAPGSELSDAPTNTPQDFLSAHNLMTAFFKAVSRDPRTDLRPLPVINDGTEAGRNRPVMDQLFESDILLTSKQMKAIVLAEAEKKAGGRRRSKRKVITGGVYRWPANRPIPFGWGHYDKEWRQTIRRGLIKWETETCLRFQEDGHGKDRLEFFKGSGCYSSVGKVGGKQKISIGTGCEDEGIVSHEVGHALGFWHEQSRPDRDSYIHLNEKFIAGGTEGNFAKRSDLEADGMGLPYDMGSVMHYGPSAFTTDWDEITIKTKDKKYQHTIGQRSGPSFIDVKQINRLYCNDICKGAPTVCQYDGYPDPNNCMICKCPDGYGGRDCSVVQSSTCGGELKALQGTWQHLTHTGKDKCIWRVKADKARIRFIVDTVAYKCDTTCRSFVEIKHTSDFQQIGFRSCCEEKDLEVISEQDEIIIIHDGSKMSTNRGGSFALRYISDHGAPLPRPPPPVWVPGKENRAFRGVLGKGQVIEKFILNALPRIRDPSRPAETTLSIFTDYVASSLLGTTRDKK
uniref:Metalloendopeptidase n=1 Tax=Panagrolaimus superbus TaxID=310955 RepID=A0A914YUL5_9BILA